ncbi:MAG: hypothetical protein H6620_11850 [Halobacteriovoraceae bacterium]|nr:hypothetical protein [Halobacteriovoraceae bacterium]
MLNKSYNIQKFSEKLYKVNTVKHFIDLVKEQKFSIEIDLTHRVPSVLTWDPFKDSFDGEYHLLVYPTISVDGKIFAPPNAIPMKVPKKIGDFEKVFLDALKDAIDSIKQVWD